MTEKFFESNESYARYRRAHDKDMTITDNPELAFVDGQNQDLVTTENNIVQSGLHSHKLSKQPINEQSSREAQVSHRAYMAGRAAAKLMQLPRARQDVDDFAELHKEELADLAVENARGTLDRDGNPIEINYYTQPNGAEANPSETPVEVTPEAH